MPTARRASPSDSVLALCTALAIATACGGTGTAQRDGSGTVGASGGTVSSSSGARLDVPAGALAAATTLTVQATGDVAPGGAPVFRLGPDGTTFARPVTITLPLPPGVAAPAVYWSRPGSTVSFDVVPATVTAGGVVAEGSHFSSVFVGPSTGEAVCASAGPGADGTSCGGGLMCTGGRCGATVSGTVSGAVIAGVAVTLGGATTASTLTDASGHYAFPALRAGSYTVTPSLAGYAFTPASAEAIVTTASVEGADFTAGGALTLSGTVSGAALAGVTVNLAGATTASTITDGAGNYAFAHLAPGTYTLTPSLAGYAFDPLSASVTVVVEGGPGPGFASWRPVLEAVSPSEGHVGAPVTLTGSRFGAAGSGGSATLGGRPMEVVSWSSTQIVAKVPSGAGASGVQVHVDGADSAAQPFTVTATVSGLLTDGSGNALAGSWAFAGDGSPAQLTVTAVGTGRSVVARSLEGAPYGALPRSFSLELPVGIHTLAVQEHDGQGGATVDLLQSASRLGPDLAVGEGGIGGLELPLRWHWEVHPLDPGFPVCNTEAQLWFRDALHGLVTFRVEPNVDPSLPAPDGGYPHGMAMATSDGGQTWSVASADMSLGWKDFRPTNAGWFPNGYLLALDSGTALSMGDNGALVRSSDFGQTWSAAWLKWGSLGPAAASPTRFARARDRLWVSISSGGVQGSVERTSLVTSTDEGLTWETKFDVCNTSWYAPNGCASQGVPLGFAGIDMACSDVNPLHCITMGYEHDNYTSVVMVTRDGFETFRTIAPKCGYFTDGQVLWLPGTDTAWVTSSTSCPGVGPQYIVTTDGGRTFSDWAPPPFTGKMAFADATHAAGWWASGVWTTRDTGASWTYTGHAPAGLAGLRTVQVLDADHVWALGHPDCRSSNVAYVSRWVP